MTKLKRREKSKKKRKEPKKGWSRIGKGSKGKGASFDIKNCRILSKWITGFEQPEIFWRSATSGGRASRKARMGIDVGMHGDIMAIDEKAKWLTDIFFFECKSYSKIDFSLFLEGKGNVIDWWKKCVEQSTDAKKWPLLVFKQNGSDTYIMCKSDMPMFSEFSLDCLPRFEIVTNGEKLVVASFSGFLRRVAPKALKTYFSRGRRKE